MAESTGRMTLDRMAPTMPVDSPIFPEPPYYYRDVERLVFTYETDRNNALDLLPDVLELPDPATVTLGFTNAEICTLGAYREAQVRLHAEFEGEPVEYTVWNLVTSDAALTAGREIWGVPKKMASVTWEKRAEGIIAGVDRPAGVRICTGIVRPERLVPREEAQSYGVPVVCLRVVPDPGGGDPLIQLVDHFGPANNNYEVTEEWYKHQLRGTGSITFEARSSIDPWHKLPVVRMVDARYSGGPSSFELHYGKVLKTY